MLNPDLAKRLAGLNLSEAEQVEMKRFLTEESAKWTPNAGPQQLAVYNPADTLLWGGQAGGGKTDLLLGLAFTQHQRSLILRRKYADLSSIIERTFEINGSRKGFNGSPPPKLRTMDGRLIQFAGNQFEGDEQDWAGRPFDLKGIDEATQLLESQVRFHLGWIRSADIKQRCRAVLASNPPISADGDWIIGFFRPWLDLTHPNPAKPGELRWFITNEDGRDEEVSGPEPIERGGEVYRPKSRTFIPAKLSDNPYLVRTDYQSTLDALPEPIRSAVRDGNFMAARADDQWQVIPMAWVLAAQARWTPDGYKSFAMTAMALDPAGGGKDVEEICWRHGGWFSEIVSHQGKGTEGSGQAVVEIFLHREDGAPVVIDVGGGYGGAACMRLNDNEVPHVKFNGSHAGSGRAVGTSQPFENRRAEAWWRMREALDPNQKGGSVIALPPCPELRADLTAPRYLPKVLQERGVIQVEPKEDLRRRLGRSPGKGDVVVMCLSAGASVIKKVVLEGGRGELVKFARSRSTGPLARYRSHRRA
jgi:hypothetical protein